MVTEVKVPNLPESVSDAIIASWNKQVGDTVTIGDNLVDLETDKIVLEVPAPVNGTLKEIKFKQGATVTSQQIIAIIEETSASTTSKVTNTPTKAVSVPLATEEVEIKVPVLPESVSDATIASWNKQVGDAITIDENLVDLETDKVVLEVPAPVNGILKEIKFKQGATVTSQQIIAIIEKSSTPKSKHPEHTSEKLLGSPKSSATAITTDATQASRPSINTLPPGAQFIAQRENINIDNVSGTGRHGAITKEDIVNHAENKTTKNIRNNAPDEQRIPMTRMRKRIAERLMQSKNNTAMLTSFNEVNLSKIIAIRKEFGEQFQKENNVKLGFMSFFIKVVAHALQRHPIINCSVDGDDIIYHSYADISVAVSTDKGLVTPVLHHAEHMNFSDIEQAITNYAIAAREGKLKLEDLQGGTFTITNGGTFGSLLSTPIVNPPQTAILGMHTIKERAIVENSQVIAAPMMYIALSYDHRVVDGKDAVLFLVDIKNQLENPYRMMLNL